MSSISKEVIKAGDYIFFEGDIESHFYIVETGQVKIFTKNASGQRVDIATLGPGETFGEFALIDKGSRTASAQAETQVQLMKISQEGYEIMMSDLPLWASSMLRSFTTRLKNMNQTLKKNNLKA